MNFTIALLGVLGFFILMTLVLVLLIIFETKDVD